MNDVTSTIERARILFERTTPKLRQIEAAVDRGALRDTGELIAQRANELVQLADAVIADATAIEGVVIEPETAAPVELDATRTPQAVDVTPPTSGAAVAEPSRVRQLAPAAAGAALIVVAAVLIVRARRTR